MNYFLDTEFNQEGENVQLLSIGIVAQDGREYYAQNQDASLTKTNNFVKKYVIPLLDTTSWKSIRTIRREVEEFMDNDPVFWCYRGNYDWVCVCGSIFGGMTETPPTWPHGCWDLVQFAYHLGFDKIYVEEPEGLHNALVDARWNKEAYEWLRQQEALKRVS